MLHHGRNIASLCSSFVTSALSGAAQTRSALSELEKVPLFHVADAEKAFVPLFDRESPAHDQHHSRVTTGEWAIRAALSFGLSWSQEMLEATVVPYLLDILAGGDFIPPRLTLPFSQRQNEAVIALTHLSPGLAQDDAANVLERVAEFVMASDLVAPQCALALAQFERTLCPGMYQEASRDSVLLQTTKLALGAVEGSVGSFANALSSPSGVSLAKFSETMRMTHQAAMGLVLLSEVLPNYQGDPDVKRQTADFIGSAEWILSTIAKAARLDRMDFNSKREAARVSTSLRVALASLSYCDESLARMIGDMDFRTDVVNDPFGSRIFSAITSPGRSPDVLNRIESSVGDLLSDLDPASRRWPEPVSGTSVAAAIWRFRLGDSEMLESALRGRCRPMMQGFLFRAARDARDASDY